MRFMTTIAAFATTVAAFKGQATYFNGPVSAGACGLPDSAIAGPVYGTALDAGDWGTDPCGKCATVTGPNGNSIPVKVVDKCPGCGPTSLDLFEDAFSQLADTALGRIEITWEWAACP